MLTIGHQADSRFTLAGAPPEAMASIVIFQALLPFRRARRGRAISVIVDAADVTGVRMTIVVDAGALESGGERAHHALAAKARRNEVIVLRDGLRNLDGLVEEGTVRRSVLVRQCRLKRTRVVWDKDKHTRRVTGHRSFGTIFAVRVAHALGNAHKYCNADSEQSLHCMGFQGNSRDKVVVRNLFTVESRNPIFC